MLDVTPFFRLREAARRRRLAARAPEEFQRRLLRRLVRHGARTRFGQDHDLARVREVADFQQRTPLRDYDGFWRDYWQNSFPRLDDCTWPGRIKTFALTSGTTTGESKAIPYTRAMAAAALRGMGDLIGHHLYHRPWSCLLGGEGLVLTGSETLQTLAPSVQAGAVSALAAARTPPWLRRRLLPPPEIARLDGWEEKIAQLAPLSLVHDVRGLGGSPNWLLLFLEAVARLCPERAERLTEWYPKLELIVHGGIGFEPYRRRFDALLEGGHAETREIYSASEGVFAVADRGYGEGLRIVPDAAVFFEFVPLAEVGTASPTRHWLGDVEPGVEYALVVTTAAGLWAYLVGDTVRLVDRHPPRLVVTGRTSWQLSVFGEHLTEAELSRSLSAAAAAVGADIQDYASTARVDPRGGGRHAYVVECVPMPADDEASGRFRDRLDDELRARNADYRELRAGDLALGSPEILFAPAGGFAAWMAANNRLGGQHKVPRVIQDTALFDQLLRFMLRHGGKRACIS